MSNPLKTKVSQHTPTDKDAVESNLKPQIDVKDLTPTAKANNTSTSTQQAQNQPIKFIPPDLSIFDHVDLDKRSRAHKVTIMSDRCINWISHALKGLAPHKASATDIAKITGAAKLLYDLEGELSKGNTDDPDARKIRDITAEMGQILRSRKGNKA